jgi:hypothetical protein
MIIGGWGVGRANRLGQLVQDLQEQSGCTKLLKDIIMERRMALLEGEFDKIEGKTDHAQESKFSKLDDVLAKVGGAWSSLVPAGVRVSLTTAIKVVVALLQHTTTVRCPRCPPQRAPLAPPFVVLVARW